VDTFDLNTLGNRRSILLSYGANWRIFKDFRLDCKTDCTSIFCTSSTLRPGNPHPHPA